MLLELHDISIPFKTVAVDCRAVCKKLHSSRLEVAPDVELWALAGGVSILLLLILGCPGRPAVATRGGGRLPTTSGLEKMFPQKVA